MLMATIDMLTHHMDELENAVMDLRDAVNHMIANQPTHIERAIIKSQLDEAIDKIEKVLQQCEPDDGGSHGTS